MVAIPKKVIEEISVKDDEANEKILKIKNHSNVNFGLATKLVKLYKALNERLGQGESEAIALAVELNADVVILDDFAARKAAMELGLKVKGTLGITKKLLEENKIEIEDINKLYETLKKIGFRVRREIFKNIFYPVARKRLEFSVQRIGANPSGLAIVSCKKTVRQFFPPPGESFILNIDDKTYTTSLRNLSSGCTSFAKTFEGSEKITRYELCKRHNLKEGDKVYIEVEIPFRKYRLLKT
ncbi:MAG: hypothetical protein LWW95_05790 [Candidatus Desulfofervidus auxilii]|nr:hypothetical protein [Candidatus Desulfofervidus auxilii]